MRFLTFQLYGPLASWGEVAVGEERDTETIPTRSAVLGLCASALGIRREEEERLLEFNRALGVAMCMHATGTLLRDYHTVQSPAGKRARDLGSRRAELGYDKVGTTLTKRHYRADAYAIVVLWQRDGSSELLGNLADALKRPAHSLFLGRKSCVPALPLAPELAEHPTLLAAIEAYPREPMLRRLGRRGEEAVIAWEPDPQLEPGIERLQTTTRWDRVESRQRWQFSRRDEAMATTALQTQERT